MLKPAPHPKGVQGYRLWWAFLLWDRSFPHFRDTGKPARTENTAREEAGGEQMPNPRRTQGHLQVLDLKSTPMWVWETEPRMPVRNQDPQVEPKGPQTSTLSDPKQKQKQTLWGKKKDSNKLNMHPMSFDLKVVSQNVQEKKLLWEFEEITNSFWQPKTDFR